MKILYPAKFYKEQDCVSVEFVDLEMCFSQGDDLPNALTNAVEAAESWLLTGLRRGDQIPKPTKSDTISPEEDGEQIITVSVDIDKLLQAFWQDMTEKYRTALLRTAELQAA
jgi:predicted RNase H-like HicB family nuclease